LHAKNMRTLATQMRLRRLLRTQADYQRRLAVERRGSPLAGAASTRLLQLLEDVQVTWTRESQGVDLVGLRPYVQRSFATMRAAAAGMAAPGADALRLGVQLREAGLPLVFFLRGLDESATPVLEELARSA
jgi:hypothetical protein